MSLGSTYIDPYVAAGAVDYIRLQPSPFPQALDPAAGVACGVGAMATAPAEFSLRFHTTQGSFEARCARERFPAQVDRVYNLVRLGYYSDDYVFRVVDDDRLGIVQVSARLSPKKAGDLQSFYL